MDWIAWISVPWRPNTNATRFEQIIARAVEQGAKVVTGGHRPANLEKGWFVEPTVLEVRHDMDIMHGESFGPVAPVCKVANLGEAIRLRQ